MQPILFFRTKEAYGVFSNFSRHSVKVFDRTWPTSEHAYQAMKFWDRTALVETVQELPSPRAAADFGRDPSNEITSLWEQNVTEVPSFLRGVPRYLYAAPVDDGRFVAPVVERTKDLVMFAVVLAKFSSPRLREVLESTGDAPLIEASPIDSYWGWGHNHEGVNRLGRILMSVRAALRG